MKKILLNRIFIILITAIICIGGTITAVTLYQSNQIVYNPSDSSFNATNVKDALDELYNYTNNGRIDSIMPFDSWYVDKVLSTTSHTTTFTSDAEGIIFVGIGHGGYSNASLSINVSDTTIYNKLTCNYNYQLSCGYGGSVNTFLYYFKAKEGDTITFTINPSNTLANSSDGSFSGNVLIVQ